MTSPQAWVEGDGARETPEDDREKAFSEFFSELELEEEVEETTGEERSRLVVVAVPQQERALHDYVAEVSVSTQSHFLYHDDKEVAVPEQDEVCHPDYNGALLPTRDEPLNDDTTEAAVPKQEEIYHSVDNRVGVTTTPENAHDDIDADLAALRDGDTCDDDASEGGLPKQEDDDHNIEPKADIHRQEYVYDQYICEAAVGDQEDVDQDLDDMLAALRQGLSNDDGAMDLAEPKQDDVNQDIDSEADVNHEDRNQEEVQLDEINDTVVPMPAVVSQSHNNEAAVLCQGRSNHDTADENISEDAIEAVDVFMSEDSDHPEPTPATTTTILSTSIQEDSRLADDSQSADAFVESNSDHYSKSGIDDDTRGSTDDDCKEAFWDFLLVVGVDGETVQESTKSEVMDEPSHEVDHHDIYVGPGNEESYLHKNKEGGVSKEYEALHHDSTDASCFDETEVVDHETEVDSPEAKEQVAFCHDNNETVAELTYDDSDNAACCGSMMMMMMKNSPERAADDSSTTGAILSSSERKNSDNAEDGTVADDSLLAGALMVSRGVGNSSNDIVDVPQESTNQSCGKGLWDFLRVQEEPVEEEPTQATTKHVPDDKDDHDDEHDEVIFPPQEDVHPVDDGHGDEHDVATVLQQDLVHLVDDNENDAVVLRGQDNVDHHHDNGETAVFATEDLPSDDDDEIPPVNEDVFEDDNEEMTAQKQEYVNHDGDDEVTKLVGQDDDNDVTTTRQEVFDVDQEADFPGIDAYIDDNEVYLGRKEQQRCQAPSCAMM
jgi:hypothetical protein